MKLFRIRAYVDPAQAAEMAALLARSGECFEFTQGTPNAEFTLMRGNTATLEQAQQYWQTIFALGGVDVSRVIVRIVA